MHRGRPMGSKDTMPRRRTKTLRWKDKRYCILTLMKVMKTEKMTLDDPINDDICCLFGTTRAFHMLNKRGILHSHLPKFKKWLEYLKNGAATLLVGGDEAAVDCIAREKIKKSKKKKDIVEPLQRWIQMGSPPNFMCCNDMTNADSDMIWKQKSEVDKPPKSVDEFRKGCDEWFSNRRHYFIEIGMRNITKLSASKNANSRDDHSLGEMQFSAFMQSTSSDPPPFMSCDPSKKAGGGEDGFVAPAPMYMHIPLSIPDQITHLQNLDIQKKSVQLDVQITGGIVDYYKKELDHVKHSIYKTLEANHCAKPQILTCIDSTFHKKIQILDDVEKYSVSMVNLVRVLDDLRAARQDLMSRLSSVVAASQECQSMLADVGDETDAKQRQIIQYVKRDMQIVSMNMMPAVLDRTWQTLDQKLQSFLPPHIFVSIQDYILSGQSYPSMSSRTIISMHS
jgi:hypothetical protein